MNSKNTYQLLLLLGTIFWGISFSVAKLAIGPASPVIFSFYRLLIATLMLSLLFIKTFKNTTWRTIKASSSLTIPLAFGIYLQTQGIVRSPANNCGLIADMCVIILPLLRSLLYKITVPAKTWLGLAVILSGSYIIWAMDNFSFLIGNLFTLSSVFSFAVYQLQLEKRHDKVHQIHLLVPLFGICTVAAFVMALSTPHVHWLPVRSSFWVGVCFCAIFSTAFMYTIAIISQRYITAKRIAIIYLFEPIFGTVAAFILLGEHLSLGLLMGGILIISGNVITVWGATDMMIDHKDAEIH